MKKYLYLIIHILLLSSCNNKRTNIFNEYLIPVQGKNGKYGFVNNCGKLVIDTIYKSAYIINNNFYIVKTNNKFQFINPINLEKSTIQFQNYSPQFFQNDLICVKIDDSLKFFDNKINCKFSIYGDTIENICKDYIIVSKDDKKMLIDTQGRYIIRGKFDGFYNFSTDYQLILLSDKYGGGYFNFNALDSNYIREYHSNLIVVKFKKKYGIWNKEGKELIKPTYDWIWSYSEKLLIVCRNNKWGLINSLGNIVLPVIYHSIGEFNEKLIIRNIHHKFINEKRSILNDQILQFNEAVGFSDNLIRVKYQGKWGFIDENGDTKIIFSFDEAKNFSCNLSAVKKENKWGFINKVGKTLIQFKYDSVLNFNNNIAFVKINNYWGLIDKKGNFLIKPKFSDVSQFNNNYAKVIYKNQYGLINEWGEEINKFYDDIEIIDSNISTAKKNNKWGLINNQGKEIINFEYDKPIWFSTLDALNFGITYKSGRLGLIRRDGKIITEPKYNFIGRFYLGHAEVKIDNKWGVIDTIDNVIVPIAYKEVKKTYFGVYQAIENNMKLFFNEKGKLICKSF